MIAKSEFRITIENHFQMFILRNFCVETFLMAVPSTAQGPITHPKRAGSAGKSSPIPHTRLEEEGQFESYYKVGSKLGEGSFGIVREVVHMTTGERWACKVVNKDNHKEKSWGSKIKLLEREVNILKRVNHEHIIRLHEVYETSQERRAVVCC
ncbi:hypothetical protein CAPTEDRAFT_217694 [Capitella teleta]|uniref:Protein kinase domain-containing protein n=1 Tax=Capitella teleta TaxID=283909 RepID=X2AMJ6_CAPTE|nr:hypothetical protein CAPTEDRAFT_217694 [Capitella teleta]|eukprot:ELU00311.1 hypothetical protein CAPTEDRAFT_217694 [Capitella teleta]